MHNIFLSTLDDTIQLAARFARLAEKGDAITLQGDLGVGKTAFCRAFIQAAMQQDETVPSPSFTLAQRFETHRFPIWHFDLYRLKQAGELIELGMEEAFLEGVSLIEWPELAESILPEAMLCIRLSYHDGGRMAEVKGFGSWEARLGHL